MIVRSGNTIIFNHWHHLVGFGFIVSYLSEVTTFENLEDLRLNENRGCACQWIIM